MIEWGVVHKKATFLVAFHLDTILKGWRNTQETMAMAMALMDCAVYSGSHV